MDFILKEFLFKKKWAPNIPGSNSTYIIRIMGTSVRNVGGEFKKKAWQKIGYWLWIFRAPHTCHIGLR